MKDSKDSKNSKDREEFKKIFDEEIKLIEKRRKKFFSKRVSKGSSNKKKVKVKDNLFGIALSGGGIRSATTCYGFMKSLADEGLLQKADYLSTVSGGGYIGSHLQANLLDQCQDSKVQGKVQSKSDFKSIFSESNVEKLKKNGHHLIPEGIKSIFRVIGAYLSGLVSMFLSSIIVILPFLAATIFFSKIQNVTLTIPWYFSNLFNKTILNFICNSFSIIPESLSSLFIEKISKPITICLLCLLALVYSLHLLLTTLRNIKILKRKDSHYGKGSYYGMTNVFPVIEGIIIVTIGVSWLLPVVVHWSINIINIFFVLPNISPLVFILISSFSLYILGFFLNLNIMGLHRFYRNRLAEAYLERKNNPEDKISKDKISKDNFNFKNEYLHKFNSKEGVLDAPYHILNCCLNITKKNSREKLNHENFIFSPLFCGSQAIGYEDSSSKNFKSITLATALAASGAAVSSTMGRKSVGLLRIPLFFLNFRLGYWVRNPNPSGTFSKKESEGRDKKSFSRPLTWWPYYAYKEILGKLGTSSLRVNVIDGGHYENLAAFELFKRRCKTIVIVDASADPDYSFGGLYNLIDKVREQLSADVKDFDKVINNVISKIKPIDNSKDNSKDKSNLSLSHFIEAEIDYYEDEELDLKKGKGKLIYIKNSLTKKSFKYAVKEDSYLISYQRKNSDFPHETTADQFFAEDQWEAYYILGRKMGKEIINPLKNRLEE